MGFINIHLVTKHQRNRKGGPFETFKKFGKSRTVPKKNRIVSTGFVGYLKVKNERARDPLH